MGNGMTCATTPKLGVAQGSANGRVAGAPPPPPPTGAVGGGGALHRCVEVVAQSMVPMPRFLDGAVRAGLGLLSTHTVLRGAAHG